MLTIRTNKEIDEYLAYLRIHKVTFSKRLKVIIELELLKMCRDFKMKQKKIKNAPDWLYD